MTRRVLLGVVMLVVMMLPAPPAHAHGPGGSTDYRSELTEVPGRLDGVELRVVDLGARLEIVRTTAREVIVLGYEGEPYLRLDRDGVWRNSSSPATYLNADRYADVSIPATADATAEPTWDHLGAGNRIRWHDHRSHWMSPQPPPIAATEPDTEHVVYEDVVRLRIDGREVSVGTRVTWVPRPPRTAWLALTGGVAAVAIAAAVCSCEPRSCRARRGRRRRRPRHPAPRASLGCCVPAVALGVAVVGGYRRSAHLAGLAALAAVVTGRCGSTSSSTRSCPVHSPRPCNGLLLVP